MLREYRILLVEDVRVTRNLFVEKIRSFASRQNLSIKIDAVESFNKAVNKLNESKEISSFYDVFFADIDLSENSGSRESGFTLVENAFKISPLTQVVIYSGEVTDDDLWPKYEELKNRGLVVRTMMKSHENAGEPEWYYDNFINIFSNIQDFEVLWDIWRNHKLVESVISKNLELGDLKYATSIRIQLDGITTLIKLLAKIDEKETIYRLVVPMYHQILERYCQGSKTNDQIISDSDDNLKAISAFYQFGLKFEPTTEEYKTKKSNPNSQRILCSYSAKPEISFALDLNWLRNKCMHNLDYRLSLNHVLYANLVLALVISGKEDIHLQNISPLDNEKGLPDHGAQKLREIINFIKN